MVKTNKRYIQQSLDSSIFKTTPKHFGGSYLKNSHARIARPVSTKNAMHVVLRSELARNEWALNSSKNKECIENVIKKQVRTFNIKLYCMTVNANHIHLLIKLYNRDSFSKFIKAVSGIIARIVLGVEKGKKWGLKFWEGIPFSRIITDWGKGYLTVKEYIMRNDLESCRIIPYFPRGKLKDKYKCRYEKTPIPPELWT
jgi:putative transposase